MKAPRKTSLVEQGIASSSSSSFTTTTTAMFMIFGDLLGIYLAFVFCLLHTRANVEYGEEVDRLVGTVVTEAEKRGRVPE
ncbi:hypothetical protein M0802_002852 [Mischocyttarus mexicanus]|nr:hypothetical protein M0802_002852 [Mischocyttarus mexicanus]